MKIEWKLLILVIILSVNTLGWLAVIEMVGTIWSITMGGLSLVGMLMVSGMEEQNE